MLWLLHFLGVDNVSGRWYGWWSGAGSDLGELAIVGGLAAMVRRHNCHVGRCWRIGRLPIEGTPYLVCTRHHPEGAPPHTRIIAAHQRHKARQEAMTGTIERLRSRKT